MAAVDVIVYLTFVIYFQWSATGPVATFYIDDFKVADKLNSLNKQIQCSDGFMLIIRVNSGYPNVVDVSSNTKEKIKLVMAKRYNAATKALDLTKFHADPNLQDQFCALFKPVILQAVCNVIKENIPEIEAINLQDNRLQVLGHVRNSMKVLKHLKVLHLGNNKVSAILTICEIEVNHQLIMVLN